MSPRAKQRRFPNILNYNTNAIICPFILQCLARYPKPGTRRTDQLALENPKRIWQRTFFLPTFPLNLNVLVDLAREYELLLSLLIHEFPLANVLFGRIVLASDPHFILESLLLALDVLVRAPEVGTGGEFTHRSVVPELASRSRAIGSIPAWWHSRVLVRAIGHITTIRVERALLFGLELMSLSG